MKALLLLLIPVVTSAAAPERITAIHFNKGKVERIHMAPGLATAVTFPCDLDEATVGRDEDLKAKVSPTSKRHLTLFLASSASQPTNLIVRCGDRQELYVFDVIPSRFSHQDVLRITGSYGGAAMRADDRQLIDSDEKAKEALQKEQEAKEQKRKVRFDPSKVVEIESSDTWKPPVIPVAPPPPAPVKKKIQVVERMAPTEMPITPTQEPPPPEPLTPEVKAIDQKRQTAIVIQKPVLIEEQGRQDAREEFKRSLTVIESKPEVSK